MKLSVAQEHAFHQKQVRMPMKHFIPQTFQASSAFTFESPAKVFQRMKIKALQDKWEKSKSLEEGASQINTTFSLTSNLERSIGLRSENLDAGSIVPTKQMGYVVDRSQEEMIPESPNMTFFRMKYRLMRKRQNEASLSLVNHSLQCSSFSQYEGKHVSLMSSRKLCIPVDFAPKGQGCFNQKNVLFSQNVLADAGMNGMKSRSVVVNTEHPTCILPKTGIKFPGYETEGASCIHDFPEEKDQSSSEQSRAEIGVKRTPERNPQILSACLSPFLLASPKIHIPRKQKLKEEYISQPNPTHKDKDGSTDYKNERLGLRDQVFRVTNSNSLGTEGCWDNPNDQDGQNSGLLGHRENNQLNIWPDKSCSLQENTHSALLKQNSIEKLRFSSLENWGIYDDTLLNSTGEKTRGEPTQTSEEQGMADNYNVIGGSGKIETQDKSGDMKVTIEQYSGDGNTEIIPSINKKSLEAPKVSVQYSRKKGTTYYYDSDSTEGRTNLLLRTKKIKLSSYSGRRLMSPLKYWSGERQFIDHKLEVKVYKGGVDYLSTPHWGIKSFNTSVPCLKTTNTANIKNDGGGTKQNKRSGKRSDAFEKKVKAWDPSENNEDPEDVSICVKGQTNKCSPKHMLNNRASSSQGNSLKDRNVKPTELSVVDDTCASSLSVDTESKLHTLKPESDLDVALKRKVITKTTRQFKSVSFDERQELARKAGRSLKKLKCQFWLSDKYVGYLTKRMIMKSARNLLAARLSVVLWSGC
ncbi:uncharacterized protein LOC119930786 [Tachyglossus aculeatus]|uniref:uncharacterized protein LOC119930786 n=1 Tax=Tachyglossus aculeatus TaxID=9261 RepID=UPI0018F29EB0|nr:uncharacterized protein LOC119930786 [Tachyglossus aculeatus]XP_038605380.1 uncharacterized protein LOC119930786 [Tachyglossus aculeatus]